MVDRAWIAAIAVVLLIGIYYFGGKLQLWSANRSREHSDSHEAPSVLYFWSSDCAICRNTQKPILEQLSEKMGDARVQITSVNVSEQPQLTGKYRVLTVPTTLVFDRKGQIKHINNGLAKLDKLLRQIESCS